MNKHKETRKVSGREYDSRTKLKLHARLKHPESVAEICIPRYICSTCDQHFSYKKKLLSHIFSAHDTSVRQKKKIEIINKNKETCKECGRKYGSTKALKFHARLKHPESVAEIPRYICSTCDRHFYNKKKLISHIFSAHSTLVQKKKRIEIINKNKETCKVCGREYGSATALKFHARVKHPESVPEICIPRRYICSTCDQNFYNKKKLIRHIFSVHSTLVRKKKRIEVINKNKETCEVCGREYGSTKALKFHVRVKHPESVAEICITRRYICSSCDQHFSNKKKLIRHIFSAHSTSVRKKKRIEIINKNKETCKVCGREYGSTTALKFHARLKHPESVAEIPRHICSTCGQNFSNKKKLKSHVVSAHRVRTSVRQNKILCALENCNVRLKNYKNYYLHLLSIHHIEIKEEKIVFGNRSDFVQWKENYESQHSVSFVRFNGANQSTLGHYVEYYVCHRSYSPKITSGRRTKYLGSCKTGVCCPSRMRVVIKKNETIAYFTNTHLGHTCDPGKTFLKPTEKRNIAKKLSEGMPFERIIEDIQFSAANSSTESQMIKRLYLIDKQDLRNIKKEFNISATVTKHQNDFFSVKVWIEEMRALGEKNPVLYVKFQDEEDPSSIFNKEDFVLVLMTQFQREMYLKFGNKIICTDGTHGLNSYDFYLYSLVIIDEFGNGIPIAFCISNLNSNLVYKTFFDSIKTQVGTVTPSIFMSDSEVTFYSAWEFVMGAVKHKLLYLWHVFKNWTEHLSKITNCHKRELIRTTLRALCYEPEPEKFETYLCNLLEDLKMDTDTHSFYIYFNNEWSSKQQQWALCYRKHIGLSTNMVIESLHKQIKYNYLSGLKCNRLDKSIHALMRLTNRDVFKHQKGASGKMRCISKAHKNSTNIKDENVVLITNNLWCILSSSKNDVSYEVTKKNDTCPEALCGLKCALCNICIHMYLCTCFDRTVRLNICKHIHAVCRITNSLVNQYVEENVSLQPAEDVIDCYVSEIMEENINNNLEQIIPSNNEENMRPLLLSKLQCIANIISHNEVFASENEITRRLNRVFDDLLTDMAGSLEEAYSFVLPIFEFECDQRLL